LALRLGDCLEVMRTLPDASVDAVVTDPPYGLAFMGKRWDYDVPTTEVWAECLRVLKPGGHLLAFAGTRTQHRMAVRIEDAGFEIRDMIAWVYGSGFPKSLDVSKAIDRAAGLERDRIPGGQGGANRILGARKCGEAISGEAISGEAQQWAGWGTALKPALEPITMARKPLEGTVAANVLAHGTGGLNVDGCRVGTDGATKRSGQASYPLNDDGTEDRSGCWARTGHAIESVPLGRWPANLIHDGSDEVVGLFPQQQSGANPTRRGGLGYHGAAGQADCFSPRGTDTGSAARFFYTAKASRDDREGGNTHPTVKPTDLMRYLCRLVTPPGGVVLDPFMGSGSTGKAAMLEGFGFIGIEREAQYHAIAERRIHQAGAAGHQPDLFTSALAA
jgi:site-specific DNA-methyltransferase (adenine-specific)